MTTTTSPSTNSTSTMSLWSQRLRFQSISMVLEEVPPPCIRIEPHMVPLHVFCASIDLRFHFPISTMGGNILSRTDLEDYDTYQRQEVILYSQTMLTKYSKKQASTLDGHGRFPMHYLMINATQDVYRSGMHTELYQLIFTKLQEDMGIGNLYQYCYSLRVMAQASWNPWVTKYFVDVDEEEEKEEHQEEHGNMSVVTSEQRSNSPNVEDSQSTEIVHERIVVPMDHSIQVGIHEPPPPFHVAIPVPESLVSNGESTDEIVEPEEEEEKEVEVEIEIEVTDDEEEEEEEEEKEDQEETMVDHSQSLHLVSNSSPIPPPPPDDDDDDDNDDQDEEKDNSQSLETLIPILSSPPSKDDNETTSIQVSSHKRPLEMDIIVTSDPKRQKAFIPRKNERGHAFVLFHNLQQRYENEDGILWMADLPKYLLGMDQWFSEDPYFQLKQKRPVHPMMCKGATACHVLYGTMDFRLYGHAENDTFIFQQRNIVVKQLVNMAFEHEPIEDGDFLMTRRSPPAWHKDKILLKEAEFNDTLSFTVMDALVYNLQHAQKHHVEMDEHDQEHVINFDYKLLSIMMKPFGWDELERAILSISEYQTFPLLKQLYQYCRQYTNPIRITPRPGMGKGIFALHGQYMFPPPLSQQ